MKSQIMEWKFENEKAPRFCTQLGHPSQTIMIPLRTYSRSDLAIGPRGRFCSALEVVSI